MLFSQCGGYNDNVPFFPFGLTCFWSAEKGLEVECESHCSWILLNEACSRVGLDSLPPATPLLLGHRERQHSVPGWFLPVTATRLLLTLTPVLLATLPLDIAPVGS